MFSCKMQCAVVFFELLALASGWECEKESLELQLNRLRIHQDACLLEEMTCKTVDVFLSVAEDCGGEWGEEWCGYVDVDGFKEKLGWFERMLGSFLVVRKVVERGEQGEPGVMWERGKESGALPG